MIDISQNIDRIEAGDTFQFTLSMTPNRPNTVAFALYDFADNAVALNAVQSGATVAESGTTTGLFYFNRVVPTSVGFYFLEWAAWDASSRPYYLRSEFEVVQTRAYSFQTYADVSDVIRNARQIFGKADLTVRDLQRHVEAADAWIDTKLASVVASTPLSTTPNFIRGMSKAGAYYFFYSERYSVEREAAPPGIVDQWDRYNQVLDGVIAGSYALPGVSVTIAANQDVYVSTANDAPIFGIRDFADQRRDPDVIDAEDAKD